MSKLTKDLVYAELAAGDTDAHIGRRLSRVASTIAYWRRRWELDGKPGLPREVAVEPADLPSEESPVEEHLPQPEPIAEPEPSSEALPIQVDPVVSLPVLAPPKRKLEVGEWYRGVVQRLGERYVLVDLIEVEYSPRGLLHQNRLPPGVQLPGGGESIQVRLVNKAFNSARQRLELELDARAELEVATPVVRPTPIPLPLAPLALDKPDVYRPSPDLCATCIKADVCPVRWMLVKALETADLGQWNSLHIRTQPLQIAECGAYRVEDVR